MRRIALLDYGHLALQGDCPGLSALLPGTAKIQVRACAICGSDIALYRGQRSLESERYFGHEFSGVVTDPGDGANGVRYGMRVASELARTCGTCWNCRHGMENYCKSMNEALLPGGFSEETLVLNTQEYSFITPIPDSLDDVTAALLEPTNCAYRIACQAAVHPGDSVLVFGLGTMGLIAAILLKGMGAGRVIGVDTNAARLRKVAGLNLMETVDRNDPHWLDQVRELSDTHGVDVVIEATGVTAVLRDAFQAVRPGGRIVVASVYHNPAGNLELLPIMRKELTVVGAKGPYPCRETDGTSTTAKVLAQQQEDIRKLITVYDYQDALQAFDDMMSGAAIKAVIRFR